MFNKALVILWMATISSLNSGGVVTSAEVAPVVEDAMGGGEDGQVTSDFVWPLTKFPDHAIKFTQGELATMDSNFVDNKFVVSNSFGMEKAGRKNAQAKATTNVNALDVGASNGPTNPLKKAESVSHGLRGMARMEKPLKSFESTERSYSAGTDTIDDETKKYIETNPEGIMYRDQPDKASILKDDSDSGNEKASIGFSGGQAENQLENDTSKYVATSDKKATTESQVKMMSQAEINAFEEEVRRYYDRPIEFIPVSEGGTSYGGIDLTELVKGRDRSIQQVLLDDGDVSCGGHRAANCSACGTEKGWCNGDCLWNGRACDAKPEPLKKCDDNGAVMKKTCTECSAQECTGTIECEKMPNSNDCRYVLDNKDARSASIYLNYMTPGNIVKPAWWFQKLDILNESDRTYFNTNGHKFGYSGFQVSTTNPYEGRVVFSIWDQGGCDRESNPSCPANQTAKTIACGSGIKCTDFGGEGTGRKSIVYSDNLPQIDEPYYMMTYAKLVAPYRMQYSAFFYVPGNAKWDSKDTEASASYTQTPPGWRFLSTIEVGTDSNEQWWMSALYSFLEQWTGERGLERRAGLFGPSYIAESKGDFAQIKQASYDYTRLENYKHVNAWSDASGSLGMEMGGSVVNKAKQKQIFEFPAAPMPDVLVSFLPKKDCISYAITTAEIELCLNLTPVPAPTKVPTSATAGNKAKALTSCSAQKVKLVSTTSSPLAIFELQVFSYGANVALQGSANHSTTLNAFTAALAIDSNNATFSHTSPGAGAWWQVDLQVRSVAIQSVQILNRYCGGILDSNRCMCRMSNADLNLYDTSGSLVATKNLGDTCGKSVVFTEFTSC